MLSNYSATTHTSKAEKSPKHEVPTTGEQAKHIGRGSESVSKIESANHCNRNIYKYVFDKCFTNSKIVFSSIFLLFFFNSIAGELVRLFCEISSLRPALESVFHRMLLYPPVSNRIEVLKFLQEFVKHVDLIVNVCCEPVERFGKASRSKDLDLIHM